MWKSDAARLLATLDTALARAWAELIARRARRCGRRGQQLKPELARFDARKIKERVDKLEQPDAVALRFVGGSVGDGRGDLVAPSTAVSLQTDAS